MGWLMPKLVVYLHGIHKTIWTRDRSDMDVIEQVSTLQDFPLQASIQAVKASIDFESYDDFYLYLLEHLPQNSPQTRKRYAELIGKRYFPESSVDNLLAQVWKAYRDERVLIDLMRVYALDAEPIIAHFVMNKVWPLTVGEVFDVDVARAFIQEVYGVFKQNSYERLLLTVRHLGFLGRYNGQLVAEQIPIPTDALLILLHDRLAPTPRIVRLNDIVEADWWRYLGIKQPEDVRQALRRAEAAGSISRYATVDELEQVTTRFTRDEYVTQAKRL
jgi:hypothetical protein